MTPVAIMTPPMPAPVIQPASARRFWKVISTKNLIGGTMFLLGVGFCTGYWFSDKVHGIEKFVLGLGVFLMIFGAHYMSSDPTEKALLALGRAARPLIPWARKNGTAEQPAKPEGQ